MEVVIAQADYGFRKPTVIGKIEHDTSIMFQRPSGAPKSLHAACKRANAIADRLIADLLTAVGVEQILERRAFSWVFGYHGTF